VEGFCYGRKDKVLALLHEVEIDGFIRGSQDKQSFGCGMAAKPLGRYKSGATSQAIVELAVCLSDCQLQETGNGKSKKT
jgi:hypothetical protein